ncbi:hypothetical protein QR680_006676 [Steinernema hermaphroditum]|uniref:C2 domain-containing protein n=1 Tax=Steinernema hermaphroditum TaxID=289476 RepID=A0AA39HYI9_9BILA|nr:hypothetical protein QR680_006676 [Steinernema hermaphroditum]
MNNNPSDWTSADEVSSFCHTPQTPGSPSSLNSFNTCKEPLLYNGHSTQLSNGAPTSTTSAFSFFQRFVGGGAKTTSSTEPPRVVKTNGLATNGQMFFDEHDDQEIDNRSVIHYELGFYEKTLTSCFRGTLTFELRYDFIHRVLMVHVLRANHLPAVERNRSSDPYVKMYLLPERRNHCKTRIFKKSLDPEFNEMFSFDVAYNNLPNRMLQFTVYDFDRFTRHGLIGNVIMRDLFEKSDLHSWTEYTMQIVGSQEKNDFGDLLLHLSYSPGEQKLYVTVSKAYNLRPMDITGASGTSPRRCRLSSRRIFLDPYVRISQIYQRRRVKMRKTSIKRANLNPVYHETIEFDLPPSQIDETNLLVQVMDWDRIGRDDLLGCCVLGKESPTKEGLQQWEDCFSSFRSSASLNSYGYTQDETQPVMPRSVAMWHSILGEVPDSFRNIPKAKK